MIKVGSDFSGVGAFDQALIRLGIEHETLFACDMDKYARQTYILNYGEPKYYPNNVYDREIPKESLDIYMTSPPCQAFSLAGKRKGESDARGILFYNSHEFIKKNRPRFFIFENVKGLLSDNNGNTFQNWIYLLGGKSVNGNVVIFSHEDSVPYHVYYQVMNSKHYGVPQNRERIFIIGIRDDEDNNFSFPKSYPLEKRLKDVLESEVDEKYFLSEKMINGFLKHKERHKEKGNGFKFEPTKGDKVASAVTCGVDSRATDDYIQIADYRSDEGLRIRKSDTRTCITSSIRHTDEFKPNAGTNPPLVIYSNTKKGYDIAEEEEDSINFSVPTSETRRGRVGKKVSQTLDTQCNQGIATRKPSKQELENICKPVQIGQSEKTFASQNGTLIGKENQEAFTLRASQPNGVFTHQRIRRLTPLECFRLMDFNENFKWDVSDSQAYKQAGNSIVVNCLVEIIKRLHL